METVYKVFSMFGVDLLQLCETLGQTLCDLVPEDVDELRYEHIENLIQQVDVESNTCDALKSMLIPRENLIQDGRLLKRIWRYIDFKKKGEEASKSIRRALVLREPADVTFDIDEELAYCQPKLQPGCFKGLSCNLGCPVPNDVLLDVLQYFPTSSERKTHESLIKKKFSIEKVRSIIAIYLDQNANIPDNDWTIDADDMDPGHVTIAVANRVGLKALSSSDDATHKVSISALETLSWSRLENRMFIFKARAEWRDDYFPDDEEWSNVTCVLDRIMVEGNIDSFFSVWSVHAKVHRDKVGSSIQDIQLDMQDVLKHIHKVLIDFECSDEYDMNTPGRDLYRAIESIDRLIHKAAILLHNALPRTMFWRYPVRLFDTKNKSELVVNDNLSQQVEIDKILKCHHSVSAVGSLHVLGHEQLSVGKIEVTIDGLDCELVVSKPERVLIDEFETIEINGVKVIKARVQDEDVRLLMTSLQTLCLSFGDSTECNANEISTSRNDVAQQCTGIALSHEQCRNRTLFAYRMNSESEWEPLCWRHKQQILYRS